MYAHYNMGETIKKSQELITLEVRRIMVLTRGVGVTRKRNSRGFKNAGDVLFLNLSSRHTSVNM